jgi:hypothetical protein
MPGGIGRGRLLAKFITKLWVSAKGLIGLIAFIPSDLEYHNQL